MPRIQNAALFFDNPTHRERLIYDHSALSTQHSALSTQDSALYGQRLDGEVCGLRRGI